MSRSRLRFRSPVAVAPVALALATLLALTTSADAGKPFGINLGGVKIGGGGKPGVQIGGGGVKINLPGHGRIGVKPPVIKPPVIKPPVIKPRPPIVHPHPPIVIRPPKPPIVCPKPPIVRPKPPIVIHPPHPPITCPTPPPVVYPKPPVVCPPPVVVTPPPTCHCQGVCHCQPAPNPWYFGMACERVQSPFGVGLRVAIVTPGGPAQAYGLKVGDILLVAGTVNLSQAESNGHGAELVQSAVTPEGQVQLTLLDASTGQLANLAMAPAPRSAPAPTGAPIALNPAQPTSTL
ncbi:hypothetical protein Pla108_32420 [Botrimarina colliarenosi]|uniref:PDZ domain-containing protein n=1 Tax=Botrimarina colliarenosi TaxID=2528001 RepID=A0A5C6A9N6_9BACT|nr:hypothetical protein [Botrimarina colliarenosi]TWT96156.1 hypothetical protein Pla108_32420 [Botrimarina colliarenosi]